MSLSLSPAHRRLLGMTAIAALLLAIYAPRISHPLLHFDDGILITQNAAVLEMTPRTVAYVFSTYDPELYIPLTFLSYQIEIATFGVEPWVFHATNLLLHFLSAVFVLLIIQRLTRSTFAAIAGALLFAVHPLQVEAVLWAAARKDVLSGCLSLASVLLFLRWRDDTDRRSTYVAAVVVFLLALLAKVHAVIVPGLLLIIDLVGGRARERRIVRDYAPFALLGALFVGIAVYGKMRVLGEGDFLTNILLLLKSAAFYLQKFFWPTDLAVLYPQVLPLTTMEWLVPAAIVVALLLCAWFARRTWPVVTVGILWYLVALVPSIASFSKNGFLFFASDRYAYVALAGVVLIIGWALGRLAEMPRGKWIATIAVMIVAIASVLQTRAQARTWRTEEALFQNVVDRYPSAALAWNNLGAEQMLSGRKKEALASFQKAIDHAPAYTVPYRNIAHIAFEAGDIAGAVQQYEAAAEVLRSKERWTSDDVSTFASFSELLENAGKAGDAFAILEEARERAPQFGDAHYNVGVKLQEQGRSAEALLAFQEAVRLSPKSSDAWYRLAAVAAELGRLSEALEALDNVLWLDPGNVKAREHRDAIRGMLAK